MDLTAAQIEQLEPKYRIRLVNALGGFRPVNLIGTRNDTGQENLAVFSSVAHFGSNPPYFGVTFRPPNTERHTLENWRQLGVCTVNHVHHELVSAAHQTSGKYPRAVSEFGAAGLTPEYRGDCRAPFVAEAKVSFTLRHVEEHTIVNDTVLVIGAVESIHLADELVAENGELRLAEAQSTVIRGLDGYHACSLIASLDQVRVPSS